MNAMMTFERLIHLAETGSFDMMLDELLRPGRRLPLPVRLRLTSPEEAPLCALALAIRHVTELTHRPTPQARLLLAALCERVDEARGRAVNGPCTSAALSPGLAAVVLRGLLALQDQVDTLPGDRNPLSAHERDLLSSTIDEQCHTLYLARMAAQGWRSPGLIGDALDSAIVLWQLGDRPDLGDLVRLPELTMALRRRDVREAPGVRALLQVARACTSVAA
ncbi:MAG: hypothetical protein KDA21_07955 [Phycisphaerales bacterium]|nr:hypothetical protein [Phycisphaerales bacterium]